MEIHFKICSVICIPDIILQMKKEMSKHVLQKSKSFAHSFIDDIYIYSQYLKEEEPKRKIPKRKQKLNPRKCPHLPLVVVSLQGHHHGDGCLQGQTLPDWMKGQGHCHLQNQVRLCLVKLKLFIVVYRLFL